MSWKKYDSAWTSLPGAEPVLAVPKQPGVSPVTHVKVGAAQTLKRGDFVVLSNGLAVHAVALPNANNKCDAGAGSLVIAGRVMVDCSALAAGTEIPIWSAEHFKFPLRVVNAATTAVGATNGALSVFADSAIGTALQVGRYRGASASEWSYVCTLGTSNPELNPGLRRPDFSATDYYPVVDCIVLAANVEAL